MLSPFGPTTSHRALFEQEDASWFRGHVSGSKPKHGYEVMRPAVKGKPTKERFSTKIAEVADQRLARPTALMF
jgi:hypothetical protein